MLDERGFGPSPRGCRSFGEPAMDRFLAQHGFQHVFRVRESESRYRLIISKLIVRPPARSQGSRYHLIVLT
jgi:hypothetical protein